MSRPDRSASERSPSSFCLKSKIERQRSGKIKGELRGSAPERSWRRSRERRAIRNAVDGACRLFCRRHARFVADQQNFRLKKRAFLINADDFKPLAAFGNQVQAPVRILFYDRDDLGGASHFGQTVFNRAHYAECAVRFQALANHFFVARFKNVQRQGSAGKENDIEREQGDKNFQESLRRSACMIVRHDWQVDVHRILWLDFQDARRIKARMELAGKVVVVTGASMGIGEAIAKILRIRGEHRHVVARCRRVEAARDRDGHLTIAPSRWLATSATAKKSTARSD